MKLLLAFAAAVMTMASGCQSVSPPVSCVDYSTFYTVAPGTPMAIIGQITVADVKGIGICVVTPSGSRFPVEGSFSGLHDKAMVRLTGIVRERTALVQNMDSSVPLPSAAFRYIEVSTYEEVPNQVPEDTTRKLADHQRRPLCTEEMTWKF